ncbi:MAG: head-tail connector protein [Patescibacteria group bacterium]|nr:head-tail connector protein [Patescibacteria group bacterium]
MADGGWLVPKAPPGSDKAPDFADQDLIDLRRHADQRLVQMRLYRSSNFTTWRELSDFILPIRGRFVMPPTPNSGNRGSQRTQRIVKRIATKAVKSLAAFLMAGITSPARNWFRLSSGDTDLDDNPQVKLWLAEVQKRLMKVFAESNFYNAVAALYEEIATFGTGVMLVEQDFEDVIRCYTLTAGEYMLGMDDKLRVNTMYREIVRTVEQLVKEFGFNNCSMTVQQLYRNNQLGAEVNVCHAIEPNYMRVPGRLGWRGMAFLSLWWEYGHDEGKMLRVGGFRQLPFVAPRWDVVAADTYGHGPGEEALPDVKMLQLMIKRRAEAVDKMVKPPLIGDASLQNSAVSLIPGGVNFVPGASQMGLKPIYVVPPNIVGLNEQIAETVQDIREAFFNDLIQMFAALDQHDMTAREVEERHEEKLLMLGPMLERFHDEALTPIIEIVFGIMSRGGLMPPAPQALHGRFVSPEYISLLAQAQKAVGTTGIERLFAFAGSISAANPSVMDKLDADETIDDYASMLGVSPKIVRAQDAVDAMRKAREQTMQQQMAAQQGLAAAQGGKVLSETDVGGGQNALSLMTGLGQA